jgi:hypothetical protein
MPKLLLLLLLLFKKDETGGACGTYGGEVYTGIWWRDLREKDHLEDGRIILKWIFQKWNGKAWIGLIWLRIGTDGRFHKIWGIS